MKTLKQIREEYNNEILNLVEQSPEELMLEGSAKDSVKDKLTKGSLMSNVPSSKRMPMMLLFRRLQYKM